MRGVLRDAIGGDEVIEEVDPNVGEATCIAFEIKFAVAVSFDGV